MHISDCLSIMSYVVGVPLHMPNKSGARCLHTAAQRGHVGVVNALINRGEKVDAKTNVRILLQ